MLRGLNKIFVLDSGLVGVLGTGCMGVLGTGCTGVLGTDCIGVLGTGCVTVLRIGFVTIFVTFFIVVTTLGLGGSITFLIITGSDDCIYLFNTWIELIGVCVDLTGGNDCKIVFFLFWSSCNNLSNANFCVIDIVLVKLELELELELEG